jgi:hypothetical protein
MKKEGEGIVRMSHSKTFLLGLDIFFVGLKGHVKG